jgi:AcrR family transcriptional regulator
MPRGRLNKERILRAAINLVDEGGLDALSMRNLGELLGAGTMSLYNHVASKDEILDGIIDLVAREIHVPKPGADWRASMRQRAISTREVILRHPWAARLIESQTNLGLTRLLLLDATLGSLRRAGFGVEAAARALLLMDSYIYGFTLQETSWRFDTSSAVGAAETLRSQVAAPSFPHLNELLVHVTSEAGRGSFASLPLEFEVGFDLILDAMERLVRPE